MARIYRLYIDESGDHSCGKKEERMKLKGNYCFLEERITKVK